MNASAASPRHRRAVVDALFHVKHLHTASVCGVSLHELDHDALMALAAEVKRLNTQIDSMALFVESSVLIKDTFRAHLADLVMDTPEDQQVVNRMIDLVDQWAGLLEGAQ